MEEKGENVGFYSRSIFFVVVMVVVRDFNHLISCVNGFFHVGSKPSLILEFRVHETFCI